MRKLIMWNIITLDGYFEADKNWDLPFHTVIWGPELEQISIDQLNSTDYLVFGRVTYEGMAAHWKTTEGEIADLMNKVPKLVISKTLKNADWNNSTLINSNVSEEIAALKQKGEGNMFVFGSAKLSDTFIKDDLFDEYRIGIAPVLLGSGRHLFSKGTNANLELVSTRQLSNGGVILNYTRSQNLK